MDRNLLGNATLATSYSINILTTLFHNLPHLDRSLSLSGNKFKVNSDFKINDYVQSLITFPALIASTGILTILGLQTYIFFRNFSGCGKKHIYPVNRLLRFMYFAF